MWQALQDYLIYQIAIYIDRLKNIRILEENVFPRKGTAIYKQKILEHENQILKEDITVDDFLHAYGREKLCKGFMVHTDQGSQYTSKVFRTLIESHSGITSNSRKGNSYDNTIM